MRICLLGHEEQNHAAAPLKAVSSVDRAERRTPGNGKFEILQNPQTDLFTGRRADRFGSRSGNGQELEHWIYKKKKNKLNNYITSVNEYAQSMGSQQNAIKTLTN